ncbi:hypothetical protein [Amycolatopsis sp. lyj-108]|uniref:hypothetical protein n=1 Tax=Amycolatopsis sp. lyj-108 TaxID=2789286 RepID=UPI00397AB2EB
MPERSTRVHDHIPPDDDFALAPCERLLWEGSPKHVRFARKQDLVIVPFLLVPCYGLYPTFDKPGGWFLLGLLVLLSVAKGVHRYLAMRASVYMVTDRRVVAWTRGQPTVSRFLGELGPPHLVDHKNGTGTITFGGPGKPLFSVDDDPPAGTPEPPPSPEINGIDHASRIRDLIADAQDRSRRER